jgi:hypothetical protein
VELKLNVSLENLQMIKINTLQYFAVWKRKEIDLKSATRATQKQKFWATQILNCHASKALNGQRC